MSSTPSNPMDRFSGLRGMLAWFASHPTAANLLMLIFLGMGFLTLSDLKRETFPDFSSSEVQIQASYPGASAEDVENAICERIEDSLDGIENLEEITSEAREGVGIVVAEMSDGGDIARFLDDIKSEVDAINDFPEDVDTPVISEQGRMDLVCAVAVSGPMSTPHLKDYCEALKDRLLSQANVSQVQIVGFADRQIRIELSAEILMQLGLSVQSVAEAVAAQSVDLPAGTLETTDRDILLRFSDERRTVHEFEDLVVVAASSGAELRLGDIATITDTFSSDEHYYQFNGRNAGMLLINKSKQEDALEVMDSVQAFIDKEQLTAPPDVEYVITYNISKVVRDRLNLLTENGIMGLILVFLAMWLFFALRFSFWVAMGLPVSFMGAFFFMQATGFSLNMLTMVGLLLALGLLMDDAIVISENVALRLSRGDTPLKAAVNGTAEVFGGVMSSFLTTLFIFGSIAALIEGNIGKVMWVMPVVLIMTLSVSLVEAFLILPNHLAHSLKGVDPENSGRLRNTINRMMDFTREKVVGSFADWAISWRYLFMGLTIAAFLSSMAMLAGGVLKTTAFPEIDGDVLQARILLPQGTPFERTQEVAEHVIAALERVNETLTPDQPLDENGDHMDLVQDISVRYSHNEDAYESGDHLATVIADLLGAEVRQGQLAAVNALWREEVGEVEDVIAIGFKQPTIGPAGLAINIRLTGQDLDRVKAASLELMDWLNGFPGVVDLMDDLRPGKPEIRVEMRPGGLSFGMNAAQVASQLRAAFQGVTATEVQYQGESFEVEVRLAQEDQNNLADLEYFYLRTPSGDSMPLSAVATLTEGRGYSRIARIDSQRTVTIRGDVDTRIANADQIISRTRNEFLPELLERYPDVTTSLEGQASEGSQTGQSLLRAMLIGIFGVFILLSLQFKSYVEPFVVISVIPLALIGVVWGHLAMGLDLSMPSIMGFVSLAGVVVNDSILVVLYIKQRRSLGDDARQAAAAASRRRFRPVLLTSLTTIVGLVPLLLERSLQAQILIPLAARLVFGLLATTVLVLFTIPSLYCILDDFGLARKVERS